MPLLRAIVLLLLILDAAVGQSYTVSTFAGEGCP
jgi:hypothetical protein